MKPLFTCIAILLLIACNSNKKKGVTVTSEDGKTTTTVDASSLAETSDALQKKAEELKKLTPYTLDQMKGFLPEELAGGKRSNFSANSMMGAAFAQATYKINDSTDIHVNLYDCAGEAGAGIYSLQYLGMMNFQSESDEEYSKTIEFKGGKAIEHARKDGSRSTLTYVASDRLLVTLEGRNTSVDQLKQMAGSLNLK